MAMKQLERKAKTWKPSIIAKFYKSMNVQSYKSDLADKSEQAETKNNTTGCLQEMRLKEQIFSSV